MVFSTAGLAIAEPKPVGPSESGWVDKERMPVGDTERRKAIGALCAQLLIVSDPAFLKKWDRPAEVFAYEGVDQVRRGQYFTIIVAFANPALDPSGSARLVVDYTLRKPDGSLYGEMRGLPAWNGSPPKPNILELSQKYLVARIESTDPLGLYRVEATLLDSVSGKKISLEAPLLAEERIQDR